MGGYIFAYDDDQIYENFMNINDNQKEVVNKTGNGANRSNSSMRL